jgi:hypothetical protein
MGGLDSDFIPYGHLLLGHLIVTGVNRNMTSIFCFVFALWIRDYKPNLNL